MFTKRFKRSITTYCKKIIDFSLSQKEKIVTAVTGNNKNPSLEEIKKVLINNININQELKNTNNLELAQKWAKKEYNWLHDGETEYIKNFQFDCFCKRCYSVRLIGGGVRQ